MMPTGARFRTRLLAATALAAAAAIIALSIALAGRLHGGITNEVERSGRAAIDGLAATLERLGAAGAPVAALPGIDRELAATLKAAPELAWIRIEHGGTTAATPGAGDAPAITRPLAGGGSVSAALAPQASAQPTWTILLELLAVAVVCMLIAWEVIGFAIDHGIVAPLRKIAAGTGRIAADDGLHGLYRIRLPLFLLIFAEALALPFLPVLARSLPGGEALAMDPMLRAALPLTAFMVCWGLSQPAAGSWSDRVGRRRSLVTGIALALVGQVLAATAGDWWQLVAARALAGIGYGIAFISCTAAVHDRTTPKTRGRGMAVFVWAFSAGTLCGTAMGGILADRLGRQETLLIAAAIMGVALIAAAACLPAGRPDGQLPPLRLAHLIRLTSAPRFAALAILAGIPPKMVITGINAFAIPLWLDHLGMTSSMTGRILMLFNLATIACSELAAPLADRGGTHRHWVLAGGLVAGAALILTAAQPEPLVIAVAIGLLGAANGIGQAPLLALVPAAAGPAAEGLGPGTVLGVFRLLERVGSMIGPLFAGLLIAGWGYAAALGWTGALCMAAVLMWIVLERRR